MKALPKKEQGFILILSMLLLLAITILVLNSVRATTMNEKMSGGYMDRSRAVNRAESALAEGQRLLVSTTSIAETCRNGCAVNTQKQVSPSSTSITLPSTWSNTQDGNAFLDSTTKARVSVALLPDTDLPNSLVGKCKPYSIMAKGEGSDSRTTTVLQMVAFVCDIDA